MNCTLMPVCSKRLPSFGLIVTAPLTDSPSMYRGTRSRRPLSSLTSTDWRSSRSSRTMSISTGVEKKREAMVCSAEVLGSNELGDPERGLVAYVIPRRQRHSVRTFHLQHSSSLDQDLFLKRVSYSSRYLTHVTKFFISLRTDIKRYFSEAHSI